MSSRSVAMNGASRGASWRSTGWRSRGCRPRARRCVLVPACRLARRTPTMPSMKFWPRRAAHKTYAVAAREIPMEKPSRVVVITGAAGGIGRALLEAFHGDGDVIATVDLPGTGVIDITAALGDEHAAFHCDVASEDEVVGLVAAIERRFGRIDVLVNNAALGPTMAATIDTDLASFRRALKVNLRGPFVLAREAARRMIGRGGVIVNIASLAGVLGNPKRNAYAASKAGLISVTRSLACEWAKHGIRVAA